MQDIKEILESEQEAENIVIKARREAEKIISKAKEDALAKVAAEKETIAQQLDNEIHEKTAFFEKEQEKIISQAKREAAQLIKKAESNRSKAEKIILEKIKHVA